MRRVLATSLPEIAIALARRRLPISTDPIVAVIDAESAIVAAADERATRHGVRAGQSVVAATVRASRLRVAHVTRDEIATELERVLEVLAEFGPTVARRLELEPEILEPTVYDDTAWVDVTGATELAGGERQLVLTVRSCVEALEHRPRIALASGPRIARALARFAATSPVITRSREHEKQLLGSLPIEALSLPPRALTYFRRLGLESVGELMSLRRGEVSARLEGAREAQALLDVRDDAPLHAWMPPRTVFEEQSFEDGVSGVEALTFVLRGMTSRLAMRLAARGEAAGRLTLAFRLDRAILRWAEGERASNDLSIEVVLPVPLADAMALLRTLVPALERAVLPAPVVSVRLVAEDIARASRDQLDLSRGRGLDPHRLQHLAAELAAELGEERVGFFRVRDAHRPEARSALSLDGRVLAQARERESLERTVRPEDTLVPTRLLPTPIPIERFAPGGRVIVDGRAHRVDRITPLARLEEVEWWRSPVTRDYAVVSLVAEDGGERSDALVFHDHVAQENFLHGWME